MKYVMFECESSSGLVRRVPIIFPDFMVHADCAKFSGHWLRRIHNFVRCEAVSAGFIDLDSMTVYGKSETLKLEHNKDDARTIYTYEYTHGTI